MQYKRSGIRRLLIGHQSIPEIKYINNTMYDRVAVPPILAQAGNGRHL